MDFREHITPHRHRISRADRMEMHRQTPKVLWFTGLSGSGKSTLAGMLEHKLHGLGFHTYLLDGDNIRNGLNNDLDFSPEGRRENIRRIAEVARLFADAGLIVLTAFIAPSAADRSRAKAIIGADDFEEIFVDCPLEECERRDTKGLYAKARKGLIAHFTGISAPFEVPATPDLTVKTANYSVQQSVDFVFNHIIPKITYLTYR